MPFSLPMSSHAIHILSYSPTHLWDVGDMMHHAYLFRILVETVFSEVDLNTCTYKIWDKYTMDTLYVHNNFILACFSYIGFIAQEYKWYKL